MSSCLESRTTRDRSNVYMIMAARYIFHLLSGIPVACIMRRGVEGGDENFRRCQTRSHTLCNRRMKTMQDEVQDELEGC